MTPLTNTNEIAHLKTKNDELENLEEEAPRTRNEIYYLNVTYFAYWHLGALYGIYLCFTSAKWATIVFGIVIYMLAELGITAGAHRLWAHRSYKANYPLQLLLVLLNSMAYQNSVIHWARDHRLHHKYCDTDSDPHNSKRGFFYAHVGWLLTKKHEKAKSEGRFIYTEDLYNNSILQFQKKYAVPVFTFFTFILPSVIPMLFWGETFNNSWHINLFRYSINLNATFLVNSVAHKWGFRPYDSNITPAQNIYISVLTLGEGFHNYHHVFPWDYKTAELGNNWLNLCTLFINFFAKIGWAYDLKSVSGDIVDARSKRTGDGTDLWGWGDKDLTVHDMKVTKILCKES